MLTMEGDSAERGDLSNRQADRQRQGTYGCNTLANQYVPVQYGWINTLGFEDALLVDSG